MSHYEKKMFCIHKQQCRRSAAHPWRIICFKFSSYIGFDHLAGEERPGCFTLVVFLMSRYCYRSFAFPLGALGLFVICDCGIPGHTHLLFDSI